MNYSNIRQSDNWDKYLIFLGWKIFKTKKGTKIALLKTFLGNVTKIQRPANFDKKELEEIEDICKKNNALFIKIEPSQDQDLSILDDYKVSAFPLAPTTILVIDLLKSEKELWDNVSSSCKYSVKRAQREGSHVECIQNPSVEKLTEFYVLAKETSKHFKFYMQPLSDLLKKSEIFGSQCHLVNVYNNENKLMAGKFFVADNKIATYLIGGTTSEGRKGKWGYDLQWQVILYLKKSGYGLLDLEGVDDPRYKMFTKAWGGFSYFKEKFGGTKIEFPKPQIKYLHPAFKFMSRFIGLPL